MDGGTTFASLVSDNESCHVSHGHTQSHACCRKFELLLLSFCRSSVCYRYIPTASVSQLGLNQFQLGEYSVSYKDFIQ